jgi:hypothetical protein
VTAIVESPTPAQVMRRVAAAVADERLIASAEELLREQDRIVTAFHRLRQLAVIKEFLRADKAAQEASDRARLTDTGGWGGGDDEAERLHGIAEESWDLVDWFVMEGSWARRLFVVDEALDVGAEYAGRRRRPAGHAVVQSGPVDWSIGRAA